MAEKKEKAPSKAELAEAEANAVDWGDEVYYPPYAYLDSPDKFILSPAAAKILGFRRYFTGVECINGHVVPRNTKRARCIKCQAEKVAETKKAKSAKKQAEKAEAA